MPYADPVKQREFNRVWKKKRRDDWFAANGPCVQCGSWDELELDHIDRSTKVWHDVWSWSAPRREAELAKCQVLCNPCHKKKTMSEKERPCGTRAKYARGCRCDPCRAANTVSHKAWRQRSGRESNPRSPE